MNKQIDEQKGSKERWGKRKERKKAKRPKEKECTKTGSSDTILSEPVLVGGSLFTLNLAPKLDE